MSNQGQGTKQKSQGTTKPIQSQEVDISSLPLDEQVRLLKIKSDNMSKRLWTQEENEKMEKFVKAGVKLPILVQYNLFPGRSKDAVRGQFTRITKGEG